MRVAQVHVAGYRSLRSIRFPVGGLTVFVGRNGVGKTNLYRALQLLQAAAAGTLSAELAAEGGMESALWAGRRAKGKPARIALEVALTGSRGRMGGVYDYRVEIGLIPTNSEGIPLGAAFALEPQVKEETLGFTAGARRLILLERRGPSAHAVDDDGRRRPLGTELLASETALGSLDDPSAFPDLHAVRRAMLGWRFHHDLRTDAASALRRPCLAVTTPTLASDGADLAAVFATLAHIREDTADLDAAVDDAFPGARLVVPQPGRTASFGLILPDYPSRIFEAGELSDGTLRYLALAGALHAHRLPPFLALNEPEGSLHPDLLDPLARMVARAAGRAQVWVVTHSERLAASLAAHGGAAPRSVVKRDGATWIEGLRLAGDFAGEADDED